MGSAELITVTGARSCWSGTRSAGLLGQKGEVETDPAAPSALRSLAHLWDQALHLRSMSLQMQCALHRFW